MVDRNVSVPACMVVLPEVTSVSGSVQCFEICSTANEWNADAMARKLPIWRYIGGHLAFFFFKLNLKHFYNLR